MKTKLDHALSLAALGFRVFPIAPNGKVPAVDGWRKKASADPDQVTRYWTDPVTGWQQDWNIGIATGGGIVALDEDNKGVKRGRDSIAILEMTNDSLPPTLTSRTPTGGRHHIYRPDHPVRNSAGRIGEGLDVRGEGGYIVGPGSTIDGKPYEWERGPDQGQTVAATPPWLAELMTRARQRDRHQGETIVKTLDAPQAVARATRYLETEAPTALEGDGGDHTTYAVAARVKDFGVSEPTAFDLMADHWNDRCSPSWPPDALQTKVANAYRYGENAIGANSPEAEFEPVNIPEPEARQRPRLYYKLPKDISPDLDKVSLVEDLIDRQAMSVLYGESNTGKTFVALDLAFHVATGRPCQGKRVEQGVVVYVAAEGGKGAEARVEALKREHGLDDFPLALVPCPVDLLHPKADTQPLIDLIDQVAQALGPVALTVIDTVSRALAGGNENASDDMGALVRNLDRIRTQTGAHMLVVHHSGKDKAKGARGHSLLRAATDTEIEVADRVINVTKQRDMEFARPVGFELKTIDLGTNQYGKAVTSCVLVAADLSARADFAREKPTGAAVRALAVLERLQAVKAEEVCGREGGAGAGGGFAGYWIGATDWRDAFAAGSDYAGNGAYAVFRRAKEKLLSTGWIEQDETGEKCRCLS